MKQLLLTSCLVACFVLARAAVVLVDSQNGGYLTSSSPRRSRISKPQLQGLTAALTGLQPAHVGPQDSKQIEELVKSSPFKKPSCHLYASLTGLTEDDMSSILAGRTYHAADLEEPGSQALQAASEALEGLISTNPGAPFVNLEQLAAEGCQDVDCLDQLIERAVTTVLGGQGPRDQTLSLGDADLHLGAMPDRLFATELGAIAAGLQAVVQQAQQSQQEDVLVLDMTMLGLEGLSEQYGQDSQQVRGGKTAAVQLLSWVMQQLDTAFNGDVTTQIFLADSASSDGSAAAAAAWKRQRRSRMLQAVTAAAFPGDDEAGQAKRFSAKAAGYGGFILLLYFLLGAAYCLCNMPIKKDTLLYGSKKTE